MYGGGKWTLGAWCRLRQDFRNFRPDRMDAVDESTESFVEQPGRDMDAYLLAMRGDCDELD